MFCMESRWHFTLPLKGHHEGKDSTSVGEDEEKWEFYILWVGM